MTPGVMVSPQDVCTLHIFQLPRQGCDPLSGPWSVNAKAHSFPGEDRGERDGRVGIWAATLDQELETSGGG